MAVTETHKMRPMTPVQLRAHLQRTLKRALEMDLPSLVKRLEYGAYQVPSTSRGNVLHLVTGTDLPLDCTCEAFGHMPLCVHRAAVLLKRWSAEGKTIALNEVGDVVLRWEVSADAYAYPADSYPALILPPPPKGPPASKPTPPAPTWPGAGDDEDRDFIDVLLNLDDGEDDAPVRSR